MKDVHSDVLYTQMKGRGCRIIDDDRLREVTPNANTKECYYIVDAVGVTEHDRATHYCEKRRRAGRSVPHSWVILYRGYMGLLERFLLL
jgi:type I restriction enzyme R subunit